METTRVITWNMNHRTHAREFSDELTAGLRVLSPNVLVLTEYVEGAFHDESVERLRSLGLSHVLLSEARARENQILISADVPLTRAEIRGPRFYPSCEPNLLHVRLDSGIDVLGLRLPAMANRLRREWWDWLVETACLLEDSPSVMIGDFNTEPTSPRARGGDRLATLIGDGSWQHATPVSGASYWPRRGEAKCLDHALVSNHFNIRGAHYVEKEDGHALVWKHNNKGLPDHAPLVVDLVLAV